MPKSNQPPFPSNPSVEISSPSTSVLLVTINRPNKMNSISFPVHWYLHRVFEWFDREPTLRCAVITGAGDRAFCAGQDLIELGGLDAREVAAKPWLGSHPLGGFAGISRRQGRKPIVAAVNGLALGGGFEMILNCDMVIASPTAGFGLPESLRGIYAGAGGLPRLIRNIGLPLASEIAMTGRVLSAKDALGYHLINRISSSAQTCVSEAVSLAEKIASVSPDAVIVTRAALREAWESSSIERGTQVVHDRYHHKLMEGDNSKEGLAAFREKRKPEWKASNL